MAGYMTDLDGSREQLPNGRIRVLEDRDQDGIYDHATTFLDKLTMPRAISLTSDGCLWSSRLPR